MSYAAFLVTFCPGTFLSGTLCPMLPKVGLFVRGLYVRGLFDRIPFETYVLFLVWRIMLFFHLYLKSTAYVFEFRNSL